MPDLALQGLASMQQAPAVKVEALEDFLRSEAPGLQVLLDQQEALQRQGTAQGVIGPGHNTAGQAHQQQAHSSR